ncbi:hypothetical protein CEUSTIGMA_g12028.t1, partial [Chlamydomonas eustigma]
LFSSYTTPFLFLNNLTTGMSGGVVPSKQLGPAEPLAVLAEEVAAVLEKGASPVVGTASCSRLLAVNKDLIRKLLKPIPSTNQERQKLKEIARPLVQHGLKKSKRLWPQDQVDAAIHFATTSSIVDGRSSTLGGHSQTAPQSKTIPFISMFLGCGFSTACHGYNG